MLLVFKAIIMAVLNRSGKRKRCQRYCWFRILSFVERIAGAAALLIGSDFLSLAVIMSALILKSVSVSYGILGTPTNTAATMVVAAQPVVANNAEVEYLSLNGSCYSLYIYI